jgi:hypothetical protein
MMLITPVVHPLCREATKWGCLAVSKALRLERTSVEGRLELLRIAGLLSVRQVGTETVYRYHPENGELSTAVDELARWYSSHRVMVISLIFSNPTEELRTYPDTPEGTLEDES